MPTDIEKMTGQRVMGWLVDLTRKIEDPDQLELFAFALPTQSTILREPAAELTQRLVAHFRGPRGRFGCDGPRRWLARTTLPTGSAIWGGAKRRWRRRKRRSGITARWPKRAPDIFIPNLALSLNNLANTLSDLGRLEEALKAAEEAVGLRRALAGARPDAFIPNLAASLNNLAVRLSALGRREEALKAAEEAVGRYRALAVARPNAFIPDLAHR